MPKRNRRATRRQDRDRYLKLDAAARLLDAVVSADYLPVSKDAPSKSQLEGASLWRRAAVSRLLDYAESATFE